MFVVHKCECGVCIHVYGEKTHIHREVGCPTLTPHLILFEAGSLTEVGARLAASEPRYPPFPPPISQSAGFNRQGHNHAWLFM